MDYYIIMFPGTRAADLYSDFNGIPETFASYEDAKLEMKENEITHYMIVGECTDDRNHII